KRPAAKPLVDFAYHAATGYRFALQFLFRNPTTSRPAYIVPGMYLLPVRASTRPPRMLKLIALRQVHEPSLFRRNDSQAVFTAAAAGECWPVIGRYNQGSSLS